MLRRLTGCESEDASLACRCFAAHTRTSPGRGGSASHPAETLVDWGRVATWLVGDIDAAAAEIERVETEFGISTAGGAAGGGGEEEGRGGERRGGATPRTGSVTEEEAERALQGWLGENDDDDDEATGARRGGRRWRDAPAALGGWLASQASRLERANAARALLLLEQLEEAAGMRPGGGESAVRRALRADVGPSSLSGRGSGAVAGGIGSAIQSSLTLASASAAAGLHLAASSTRDSHYHHQEASTTSHLRSSVPSSILSRTLVAALGSSLALPPADPRRRALSGAGQVTDDEEDSSNARQRAKDSHAMLLPTPVAAASPVPKDDGVSLVLGPSLRMVVRFEVQ